MALADTARLVASLELQDKFSRTADKFDSRIGRMDQHLRTFGRNVAIAGVAGLGFLAVNVQRGIESLMELENVTAATNAVIESTGGVAGISAEKVRELAEEYEGLNATMDDKVIQSAENLLLTFTNITEEAFEPALQAALDMNQAMGGGEEGLQSTIIQVGKALQDPIRGATALRRVGVNLSRQQQDQIKVLIEQNDLYSAQRIILDELATEFGGQFAAAGDTAAGKFAKLRDTVEDAQMSLATALLPAIEEVAEELSAFLGDPEVQRGIQELGGELADGFRDFKEIVENLPWDAIKETFKVLGSGAKAFLDAFTNLPPEAQTLILSLAGLNKLTGGAVTTIFSTLASGLIKGILNMNAGVVNINAATVTGPGGGPGTPPIVGGKPGGKLPIVGGALGGFLTALGIGELTQGGGGPTAEVQAIKLAEVLRRGGTFEDAGVTRGAITELLQNAELQTGLTEKQLDELRDIVSSSRNTEVATAAEVRNRRRDADQARQALANLQAVNERTKTEQAQHAARAQGLLQRISEKEFSPKIAVTVTSNVTISDIQRKIISQQIAIGKGPLEFE